MFDWKHEDPLDEYDDLRRISPIMQGIDELMRRGNHDEVETLKIAIVVLVKSNEKYKEQLEKLERIRPRLFFQNGAFNRWDAPDELLPIENDSRTYLQIKYDQKI